MPNLTDLPIIDITWVDSHGGDNGWEVVESLDDVLCRPLECRSVGFVLKESDDCIVIAHNVSNGHDGVEPQFTMGMTIPKCAIVKRVEI